MVCNILLVQGANDCWGEMGGATIYVLAAHFIKHYRAMNTVQWMQCKCSVRGRAKTVQKEYYRSVI